MANALVVYYSRKGENFMPGGIQILEKGHTAFAAEFIAEAIDGDLFEIDTIKPYAENYRECCMEAATEAKAKARPEIKGYAGDISMYDTIYVCYPCWCGTAPMCIFTFLEHYDWKGKKIVPLCTNEGSGLANSITDILASCPGANVAEGLSIRGHQVKDSQESLSLWAKNNL
jgi:flavodoxin